MSNPYLEQLDDVEGDPEADVDAPKDRRRVRGTRFRIMTTHGIRGRRESMHYPSDGSRRTERSRSWE